MENVKMPTITGNLWLVQPMLENKSVSTLKTVSNFSVIIRKLITQPQTIIDTAEKSSVVTRRCQPKGVFGVHCKYESQGYHEQIVCTCDSDNCNRDQACTCDGDNCNSSSTIGVSFTLIIMLSIYFSKIVHVSIWREKETVKLYSNSAFQKKSPSFHEKLNYRQKKSLHFKWSSSFLCLEKWYLWLLLSSKASVVSIATKVFFGFLLQLHKSSKECRPFLRRHIVLMQTIQRSFFSATFVATSQTCVHKE